VTVTTQDSRIHFDGSWVVQDSGVNEYTTTIGSSVSLTFPGTAVFWHATFNPNCGIANVSVDDGAGVLIDASTGTSANSTPIPAILFATSGLEPARSHLINITLFSSGKLGGTYMEMYNLSYTQDGFGSSTSGSDTSSNGTSSSGATHSLDAAAIAGGVVGGVLGSLVVLGVGFVIFRRRTRRAALDSLTTHSGQRTTDSGISPKSEPIYLPPRLRPPPRPRPLPLPPQTHNPTQSQRSLLPSSPISTSGSTPSASQQTTFVSSPLYSYPPSATPLILNRSEPAPSLLEDPPPPYNSQTEA